MTLENTTSGARPAILDLILPIIERWNKADELQCQEHNSAYPGDPSKPDKVELIDVMTALAHGHDFRSLDVEDIVRDVKEAILEAVNAESKIDPWPNLTRRELQFLVGGRSGDAVQRLFAWRVLDRYKLENDTPITLSEKLLAARHRVWLEKGADKRRAKLAKAKAVVAAMEGGAAA